MGTLEDAVEAAHALGAELDAVEQGEYDSGIPGWLHAAVFAALPEHMGFGCVEGVLMQRGPYSRGGFRIVETPRRWGTHIAFVGLDVLLPVLRRARLRRLMLEQVQ